MSLKQFLKENPFTAPFWSAARYVAYFPSRTAAFCVRSSNKRAFKRSAKILKQYKNRYAGKRCFIIGNGPSLIPEDLDKIRNEFSFASNRIYLMFSRTKWRPVFYSCQDYLLMLDSYKEISQIDAELKIIPRLVGMKYPDIKGAVSTELKNSMKFLEENALPEFSEDITDCLYEGMTITYSNMQAAAYMGFSEIILLGVDHSYSVSRNLDGTITRDSSVKDYFSADYIGDKKFGVITYGGGGYEWT